MNPLHVCAIAPSSARLPKPPVGLVADPEWLPDVLQKLELTILRLLQEQESRAKEHSEQHHIALCKLTEEALSRLECRLAAALHSTLGSPPPVNNGVRIANVTAASPVELEKHPIKPDTSQIVASMATSSDERHYAASHFEKIQKISRAKLARKVSAELLHKRVMARKSRNGSKHLYKLSEFHVIAMEQEMQRKCCPPLQRFVRSHLDNIIGVFIAASTLITYLQTQFEGCKSNEVLGVGSCGNWHSFDYGHLFHVLDLVFNLVFAAELIFRALVLQASAFGSKTFWMDAVIVLGSMLDEILSWISDSGGVSVGFLRVLRCVRFIKTLRVIREFQFFQPLRILTTTILHSFASLGWSMLVLCVAQLIAALLLCQSLHHFIQDTSEDYDTRIWVNRMYGTSSKALYTMFEVTLSGGWPTYVRPLVEEVSPWYAAFYLFYVVFVVFALIRIMTALFLKETLAVAAEDAELEVQRAKRTRTQLEDRLLELFELADLSGDGCITIDEFTKVFNDPSVKTWCKLLDIHVKEACSLFDLIDDGDGSVSYAEFLEGISRLRGTATSQDVVSILHDCHHILTSCEMIRREVTELRRGGIEAPPVVSS